MAINFNNNHYFAKNGAVIEEENLGNEFPTTDVTTEYWNEVFAEKQRQENKMENKIMCDVCKVIPAFYKGSSFGKYVFFCPTCLDKENK